MSVHLASNEKIAETSSKGNQEKWLDQETGLWYKLDQFGYEALAESAISLFLEMSNIESDTPFTFARYWIEKVQAHGRERIGCVSRNFLKDGQKIVTVNSLLTNHFGVSLKQKLARLSSNKQRIAFLAESTAECTGLQAFPQYLTLLFEIDALFCNDDRHLNNIAVIEQDGSYDYCPIFDNGAGLLSNVQFSQMDIEPKALISALKARPFNTTFNRQTNAARERTGKQLVMPKLSTDDIREVLESLLEYYPARDRGIITDRVVACILTRQRAM